MSLAQLLSRLCSALPDLAAEEVADALYLAAHLPATTPARALTAPAREPIGPGASEPPTKRPAGAAPPAATEPDHRQPEQGRADGTASLYAWRPAGDGAPGLDFRTPQAPPLPGRIELGRALRPLLARAPSAHARALDVAATVRQIADTGLWLPVMRPVAEPRFGVALVLDDTPSMAIWRSALVEFTRLLERHTALRELRCYRLSFDASGQGLLAPGLDRGSGAVPRGAVGELADPSGRTLVLLASDAVGCHWSDGRMARTLAAWARHTLVALVQMLPETLWERSALGSWPAARVMAGPAGTPNGRLSYLAQRGRMGRPTPAGVPLPVLNLQPDPLAGWARLAAGRPATTAPAYLISLEAKVATSDAAPSAPDPAVAVRRFRGSASPLAQHLAGLLAAAAPLSLPVAHLVRGALLPEARQVHLAEVWLSGLLRRVEGAPEGPSDPEEVIYEFYPGVREQLSALVPGADSLAVLREVSAYIGANLGQPQDFRAWLQGGEAFAEGDPRRPFAAVAAGVLRGFGGAYRDLAEGLARAGGAREPDGHTELPTPHRPSAGETARAAPRRTKGQQGQQPIAGRYRIEALQGTGAFAETFRAYDTQAQRTVLVKRLRSWMQTDKAQQARFEQERQILSRLSHPNLLRLYDDFVFEGAHYLVLELLGERLRETFIRRPFRFEEILADLRSLAEGIDYLHAQGFVHNDISPTNLYWHAEGAIVLASFGYASPTGTRLAEVMTADDDGPTSAMVPGLTAEGALTPATDLYCFARALIALATQAIRTLPQLVLDVLTQPLRPGAARFERATAYIDAIRAAVEGSAQGEARSPDITASAEDESRPIVGAKRAHEAPRFTELVEQLRRPAYELVRWCRTMLVEEFRHGLAFRVVVLAKLILDLDPASPARVELDGRPWLVGDLINSISQRSYSGQAGQRVLYDPFLSPLSPVTLTYLLERSRLIPYQAGAPVVRQDEPADALFIVVTGALELYRNEARLKVLSPDGEMTDVVLEEGSIFGEMSLFAQSPRYAATLVARQPTAVLSLAYGDIVGVNMPGRVTENHIRVELRAHLWRYYTSRTIEQHIQWHELLKHLPPKAQTVLTHSARFIPANYSDEVTISAAELWEEWVLIIAGAITVYTNSASLTYTAGDWIGPLRLVVETNPYTEVACSRDAQFVAIPADLIMSVTDENESFRKSCVLMALNERMRLVA